MGIMDQSMGPGDSMISGAAQPEAAVVNEAGQQGAQPAGQETSQSANAAAGQAGSQGQPGAAQAGQQAGGAEPGNAALQERKAESEQQGGQQAQAPQPRTLLSEAEDQPISDWSRVDLRLGDALVDGELVESYGKLACEVKLTEAQARALAHWQLEAIKDQQERLVAQGQEQLRKEWGASMGGNIQSVAQLCDRLGRVPGLENFRRELEASGGASNPVVIKGLLHVAQLLREDSTGKIGGQGSHVETAEEGIRAAFARARGENA